MRKLAFYYTTDNIYSEPVTEHDFLLRCIPQELAEQHILDFQLRILPLPTGGNFGLDSFGNRTYTGRVPEDHMEFRYTVSGQAIRDDTKKDQAQAPLPCFSYPSALTRPSDNLADFLATIPSSGSALDQAEAIREAVFHRIAYMPGVTTVSTTAAQALEAGVGVCQDFTHIFLALCRMRKIPARYVSGLPQGEGASHAWAEIWLDGYWIGIDPTRNCLATEAYLKFCTGRDFQDCPIEQGVFRSCCSQKQTVFAQVTAIEE
jgi:transglutaminase-like putative cysteine protease